MEWNLVLLVIGMAVVTYIPRVLPLVFLKSLKLTPKWKQFFRYIPFAVLGALIFPGIFHSTGDMTSATGGLVVASVLAWFRVHVVLVVIGGILGVFLLQMIS